MDRTVRYQTFAGKNFIRLNSLEQLLRDNYSRFMTDIRISNGL